MFHASGNVKVDQFILLTCHVFPDTHSETVRRYEASLHGGVSSDWVLKFLPRLKIRIENAVDYALDHHVRKHIVCRWYQVGVSQKQQDRLMWEFTRFLRFCVEWPAAFGFWHGGKVADVQEIQKYLWENLVFHNYGLQVELQALPPLLQDLRNPVPDMFWGDFGWLYALL